MIIKNLKKELEYLRDNYLRFGKTADSLEASINASVGDSYQADGAELKELNDASDKLEELHRFVITNKEFEIKKELGKIIYEFTENEGKELTEEVRKGVLMERYSITGADYSVCKEEFTK